MCKGATGVGGPTCFHFFTCFLKPFFTFFGIFYIFFTNVTPFNPFRLVVIIKIYYLFISINHKISILNLFFAKTVFYCVCIINTSTTSIKAYFTNLFFLLNI